MCLGICYCDVGWIGDKCDVVICGMFCISYGNCMVLDMCMCECGW